MERVTIERSHECTGADEDRDEDDDRDGVARTAEAIERSRLHRASLVRDHDAPAGADPNRAE
jgi:hypothetical protein